MNKISVIIPAAGLATRMRPLSNNTSKAMIPLNGKPIIHYILSKLRTFEEVNEVIIVQNKSKDIENFCSQFSYPFDIKYIIQEFPMGPLDAVLIGFNETIEENNIMVWLGDTICLEKEFDFTKDFLVVSEVKDQSRWCLVDKQGKNFYDKPKDFVDTNLALIGIYYFCNRLSFNATKHEIFYEDRTMEIEISEFLELYKNGDSSFSYELVNTQEWYDCGELSTYYESKARLINNLSRSENKIEVNTFLGSLIKTTSRDISKIEAEKKWFRSMRGDIQFFLPKIFDASYGQLKMSWEPGFPLNELWLYDDIRTDQWVLIVDKILTIYFDVLIEKRTNSDPVFYRESFDMYVEKNLRRIADGFDLYGENYQKIYDFVLKTGLEAINNIQYSKRIHGDLHIGNILFEPFSGKMTFLDPRGFWSNTETIYGDINYDLAKIFHDWYVGYMMILGEKYEIGSNGKIILKWDQNKRNIIFNFICEKLTEMGYNIQLLKKMSIVLVLTCIPFHSDDVNRQKAFVKRCLDLIEEEEFPCYSN